MKTPQEILTDFIKPETKDCQTAIQDIKDHFSIYPVSYETVVKAMEEYASQFKVEPVLSLQQCKDEVAMKNGFNSWIAMNEARYIKDHRDDYEIHLNEVLNEAVELYTASLTSEIKGLREDIKDLRKICEILDNEKSLAYDRGYKQAERDCKDTDWPDGQRKGY